MSDTVPAPESEAPEDIAGAFASASPFGDMADLGKRECKIGDTSFRFEKMLPMEGFRVLEALRRGIGVSIKDVPAAADSMTTIIAVLATLPENFVDRIRREMFNHVHFSNKITGGQFRPIGEDDDMAFTGLEPSDVYEVLVRSLAVNFTKSFSGVLSRIGGTPPDSPSQNTPT